MKPSKQASLLRGQTGQATIEYILLLVVVVSIMGGIIWRFNTAFAEYTESFFDGYVACLLETGELPGIGDCKDEWNGFDLENGSELALTFGTSGGSSDPSGSGSTNSNDGSNGSDSSSGDDASNGESDDRSKNAKDSTSGQKSQGETLGGGSSDDTASAGPAGSSFLKTRKASTSEGNFNGTKEEAELAGLAPITVATAQGSYESGAASKTTGLGGAFSYFGQEEDEERAARPPVAPMDKKAEGADSLRAKVTPETGERAPAKISTDEENGFSFGYLLRMLLICGLIIAIIVFFGGQILQASKSWEK